MKNIFEPTTCLKEEEIKRYLAEQSSAQELHRIEDHLLDCPFCTDAVEGFQANYDFAGNNMLDTLKEELLQNSNLAETTPKIVPMSTRSQVFTLNRIAAAVLLLLIPAAGWLYWNSTSGGGLLNDFGSTETLRSAEKEGVTDAVLLKAISLLDAGQYEAALSATQKILDSNTENIKATYYAGLAALKATQYELAEDYFMTLRLNSDFYFEDASWQMVQACLGANKKEKAKHLLEEILLKPDGIYYDQAKELMESF